MARYPLIVFDWDGTLMDSAGAIVRAIQAACVVIGLPPPSHARASHVIGLGLSEALQHAVPELTADRYPEMIAAYRHHYLSADQQLVLFAGVEALVRQLVEKGHLVAVATGKSRIGLDRAMAHTGLTDLFHATRCADECPSKPHPAMLEELMLELGCDATGTLMIGDTTHDLQMAKNAGVDALAVSYGAHTLESLESCAPLACVHSSEELAAWLHLCA